MLPSADHAARAFAEAFARLIRLAPRPAEVSTLDPAPSWAAWNHAGDGLWPCPEDPDVNLNEVAGPEWIDDAGRRARDRLRAGESEAVIGHCDWLQVVTVGLGVGDGRDDFAGIPFLSLPTLAEVGELDGTVVFVNEPHPVATRYPAFLILHNPPPIRERLKAFAIEGTRDRALIATSRYAAALWAAYLDVDISTISVVYPFAEPCFAVQSRPGNETGKTRVLFAGRLSLEKGIYTLLETLHIDIIEQDPSLLFTATTAGADKPQGKIIERLLGEHPGISVVATCKTPARMAALMAGHDIVVMPSNSQYWHETFGIVSIEAQHSGCRVIASGDGGLPETDCGGVVLVRPDNAEALAWGIREAVASGPLSPDARQDAGRQFTVGQSVDRLLNVFAQPLPIPPAAIVRQLEELMQAPAAEVPRTVSPDGALTEAAP